MKKKRMATIIAHYDSNGIVNDDLINMIRHISDLSTETYFISTKIKNDQIEKINKYANVISRENYGYDFWSYKIGIDQLTNKKSLDSILIFNSSFIIADPTLLIEKFFSETPDYPCLKGISKSNEIDCHIQSYWIQFNSNSLINSEIFEKWWSKMTPISEYREVIKKYEVGMSQYFSDAGIPLISTFQPSFATNLISSCRAIGNYHLTPVLNDNFNSDAINLKLNTAQKLNPTSLLWDFILAEYGIIKAKIASRSNRDFNLKIFESIIEKKFPNNKNYLLRRIQI